DANRVGAAQRLLADGADKPLLALSFADARHGLVVGAYGLALSTADGGHSWQSSMDRLPNPRGLHLYALARQGADLYIAGE
ncbi:YCF48-related protein, partial [Pseudomonas asplenii]